jgi:Phage phiEco32-like COOH.NH2 ligase-type 2
MALTYRQIFDSKLHTKMAVFHLPNSTLPRSYYLSRDGKSNTNQTLDYAKILSTDLVAISEILPQQSYWIARFVNAKTGTLLSSFHINPDDTLEEVKEGEAVEKFKTIMNNKFSDFMIHNFTIGSDPEIFVEDEEGNCIPSWLFLQGKDGNDKTSTLAMYGNKGDQKMYWDGFQAEFCVFANTCNEYHTDSVAAGLRGVRDAAKKRFPKSKLSATSVFDIPPALMESASDEHVEFGCMPSYNAYGIAPNLPPGREVPFRSAGGHIHFGIGKTSHEEANPIIKTLDKILGVACVSLFAEFDSRKRRHFYGLPGEYRLPPHGVEYRPLSNAWLIHPVIMNLVVDISRKCVVLAQRGWSDRWVSDEADVIDTVIRCDVDAARASLEKNKKVFIHLLRACYGTGAYHWATDADLEVLFNVFMNGLESAVADPRDLVKNWKLNSQDHHEDRWYPGNKTPNCRVSTAIVQLRAGNKV